MVQTRPSASFVVRNFRKLGKKTKMINDRTLTHQMKTTMLTTLRSRSLAIKTPTS